MCVPSLSDSSQMLKPSPVSLHQHPASIVQQPAVYLHHQHAYRHRLGTPRDVAILVDSGQRCRRCALV